MRAEISGLQRRLGIATVFVTHDQDEALTMSDRIAVMRQGQIEQIGSAQDIYERPATAFVATFIGSINQIRSRVTNQSNLHTTLLETGAGPARLPIAIQGTETLLTIRPERLNLAKPGSAPADAIAWPCTITAITYLGARLEVTLRLADGSPAIAHLVNTGQTTWQPNETAEAWFRPEDAWPVPVTKE